MSDIPFRFQIQPSPWLVPARAVAGDFADAFPRPMTAFSSSSMISDSMISGAAPSRFAGDGNVGQVNVGILPHAQPADANAAKDQEGPA